MNCGDHYSTCMFRKLTGNMHFFTNDSEALLRFT